VSSLAAFAHFDPDGLVAPHVERHIRELSTVADRLVIVSTAPLTDRARATLASYGELIERENVGYDFCSWRAALLPALSDGTRWDRVLISNDSCVGPLRPYRRILTEMATSGADVWGVALSRQFEPHIQSFFVCFEAPVVRSSLLYAFWNAVTPLANRWFVVNRYELGLSRLLRTAGFTLGAYYDMKTGGQPADGNPMIIHWDKALDGGLLPFVKVEVLRDDPAGFGADLMLRRCEERFPEQFEGVRDYIERTREAIALARAGSVVMDEEVAP
jgi:lipopolysaccharide biosynthesis protein